MSIQLSGSRTTLPFTFTRPSPIQPRASVRDPIPAFDSTRSSVFSLASATTGILILLAVIAPSTGLSIALFGAAGISSGPIFPLIVAIGGDRYPDRSAAIGGYLAGAAVVGGISYPPVMGFLSVTVGLPAAMTGAGALSLAAALVLVVVRRR